MLPALRKWHDKGISCNIYSSGSVFAQKLLLGHIKDQSTDDPKAIIDERGLIQNWFDTTNAGLKTEASSYKKIADELAKQPGKVLFLSDNVKEIKAALDAGMMAIVVDRPGNAEVSKQDRERYSTVDNFEALEL